MTIHDPGDRVERTRVVGDTIETAVLTHVERTHGQGCVSGPSDTLASPVNQGAISVQGNDVTGETRTHVRALVETDRAFSAEGGL